MGFIFFPVSGRNDKGPPVSLMRQDGKSRSSSDALVAVRQRQRYVGPKDGRKLSREGVPAAAIVSELDFGASIFMRSQKEATSIATIALLCW